VNTRPVISHPIPVAPALSEFVLNSELKFGDIIWERSERGNVVRRFIVMTDPVPCSATLGNVHVMAREGGGAHKLCYAGICKSEVAR
jgi:hypothetical protein